MSTLAKRCQKQGIREVSSIQHAFSPADVTTVYDALIHSDDQMLVKAMLQSDETQSLTSEIFEKGLYCAVESKITSMKRIAYEIGPNLEVSARDVLIPWDAGHLSSLIWSSWPNILGRRIALPLSLPSFMRHKFLANVLLSMSYV